jgi:lipopolysaccharide export system protein LptA
MKRIQCWIILLLGMVAAGGVQAEKADASKPTNIEANQMAYDDVKQINTFTGDVVLVRGTLTIKADRMVVTQDPAGYQYATVYAKRGEKAMFRQKRDGGPNLWIEGEAADRIEYDTKTEVAKFYVNARVRLLEGTRATDEVEGEFISYDSKQEFYSVNNTASGTSKAGGGRIRAIIQPRNETRAP